MHSLIVENVKRMKRAVPEIKSKINVKISFDRDKAVVQGDEFSEFVADSVIRAVDFGFDVEDALVLKDEDFVLEFIDIKEHTRRRNLQDVRSRIIGTRGKAKKTIEELTGAFLVIKDNKVGIIVDSEHLEIVCQAVVSLIQGAKHGNVFSYIEKQNSKLKKFDKEDLGLRESIKKLNK
jgi:ribosomal RNA assembly protein